MFKHLLRVALLCYPFCFFSPHVAAQGPTFNAQQKITPYTGQFRVGYNGGWQPGWNDKTLADMAAGNAAVGAKGVGLTTVRQGLFYELLKDWGTAVRIPEMQHFESLKMGEMTAMILGGANGGSEYGPPDAVRDQTAYCPTEKTQLFKNLYLPIWDNGANGTPYNEDNYFAAFLYQTVSTYKDHVRFWEIWNEPGFDLTYDTGWRFKGDPKGNWWDRNPLPCEYMLRGPFPSYIRMLRIAYEIIKTVDPDSYVYISSPGYGSFMDAILRNTDNPDGGKVSAEYPLTGGAYFEGIAYHAYPHFDGSAVVQRVPTILYERTSDRMAQGLLIMRDTLQRVLSARGYDGVKYPKKEFIITETNLPRKSYGNPAYFGSELVQRNFMIKAYVNSKINNIHQMHIYSLAENKPEEQSGAEFDIMGLYRYLGGKTVATAQMNASGIAMKTVSDLLHGTTYDAAATAQLKAPATVRAEAFKRPDGKHVVVLWAKATKDLSEEASATYSFPAGSLTGGKRSEWDASQTNQSSDTNGANLALTTAPIFVVGSLSGGGGTGGGSTTPEAPILVASSNALCGEQAVTIRVTNRCTDCTVAWSNGQRGDSIRVTQAGEYTATMTNKEGVSGPVSNRITLSAATAPTPPVATVAGNTTLCPGDSVTLRANLVCNGCTVRWSNGQTGTTIRVGRAGTYTASTLLAPCNTPSAASNVVTVTQIAATAPSIAATGTTTLCPGDSVVLRAVNVCTGCTVRWSTGQTTTTIAARGAGNYTVTATPAGCTRGGVTSTAVNVTAIAAPSAPTLTATGPTAFCVGDSVVLRANNVCTGCTVRWSTGQTGTTLVVRQAGTYTAAVSSSTCSFNSVNAPAVTITTLAVPAAPSVAIVGGTSVCGGDSVVLRANNVCAGCTVLWSNGRTGTTLAVRTAGTYSAQNRAPGCSQPSLPSNGVVVSAASNPTAPQISADGPTNVCAGGVTILRARGVCNDCTVEWSNGETGPDLVVEQPGRYTALVRTRGACSGVSPASNTIEVTQSALPTPPTIRATGGSSAVCQGQTTTLTVANLCSGCVPRWSTGAQTNSISVSQTGVYTVVARNSCGASAPARDTVRERLYLPQITVTNACTLTAPAGRDYKWFLDGIELLAQANRATFTATANGTYNVMMTSADGCRGVSLPAIVQGCARPEPPLARATPAQGLRVFPNPAASVVFWQLSLDTPADVTLQLYSPTGTLVHQQTQAATRFASFEERVEHLPLGLYFYTVVASDQRLQGKIMVQRQ